MLCLAAFLLLALAPPPAAVAIQAAAAPGPGNDAPSCPFDLATAAQMIPREGHANATAAPGATGCCWYVFAAYVNSLGTGDLVPSPPPPAASATLSPPAPVASSSSSSKNTVGIAAGSAAAGVAVVVCIGVAAVAIARIRRRRRLTAGDSESGDDASDDDSVASLPPLPREGLYIFTKTELMQATNGYDKKLLLGTGGAGKVYLGHLPSGQRVAIKKIYRAKKVSEFYAEVAVLAKLRHRNLTTLVGYCLGGRGGDHALVYKYLAGGNLWHALFQGELPWCRRLEVAVDVAEGLAYLHGFREGAVVHRDVKPTNVLLSESGAAKLSDFGVLRIVPEGGTHVSTEVRGTRGYVDPESFSAGHVSEAADVYSFGVVLLELATGMRAVVPTPLGGAESIVQAAHWAVTEAGRRGHGGPAARAGVGQDHRARRVRAGVPVRAPVQARAAGDRRGARPAQGYARRLQRASHQLRRQRIVVARRREFGGHGLVVGRDARAGVHAVDVVVHAQHRGDVRRRRCRAWSSVAVRTPVEHLAVGPVAPIRTKQNISIKCFPTTRLFGDDDPVVL
ncbi:proline-rich receptor-like protein kinase PERK3 [Panicum miliaceum]|uniref:Proline-rich receptor-like protein kinase PERK3 n=1 Tax=Panicum miliaceum TaxID=4540 RepID=A0A3L6T5F0_PANMI|nr:proline-rich receptor-like protein kinase PERK3 [Panicum miliaceum]